ncbi:MAG TPA: CoA-binding protein [Peptococcaceae bacterium]|jgi:acetyl coenzyme A synthetase (ADP forming)-like protein|nr:CoA-binding protein [Peptococcaceae bacterium]
MGELTGLFRPGSLAVIGASRARGKIGNAIMRNIIESGYQGKIYPINPKEKEIEGLTSYPSIGAVPGDVDMAVISVPASKVLVAAGECGEKGVKALTVITAGFKETGKEGLDLEKKLLKTCHCYGMQMLGPNCVGLLDTHTPINASFAATFPIKGDIAFLSQSGAILLAILDWSSAAGLGFSKVVSLGNKADLSEIDFIQDAANDPYTRVILCYIEDIVDGARFLEVAGQAARKKPVIVLKSGVSQAGAQAASSHTGALAGSDLAYTTAFAQCGIIRARSMTELFDLAMAFSKSVIPAGNRVAIVTNSGGPGIIATDNVEQKGLAMARFDKKTIEDMRANLPQEAGIYNPVDVLGDAGVERFEFALEKVMIDPNVDSVLFLLCPTAVTRPVEISQTLIRVRDAHPDKPVFAAYTGGKCLAEGVEILSSAGIPCFTFPEPAIECIRGLYNYSLYRRGAETAENGVSVKPDKKTVKAVFYDVIKDRRLTLMGSEAAEVASAYGIPAAPVILTTNPEEAVAAAGELGYPVVLKVASPKIMHKTDVGGVKIGIQTPEEVRLAFIEIMESVHRYLPKVIIYGIEVQKMMPKGTELIVGMTRDVQFGPLIAFGLGGIYVNLFKDVAFRLADGLTGTRQIEEMLTETKAYTLLRGYRGESPRDIAAVVDVIRRTARLVTDFPEINEIDINPLFAYEKGLSALDIKITIS